MIYKEQFLLIRGSSFEIEISEDGPIIKKRKGQLMLDFSQVEFIQEGETASETIISMKSSARFLIKQSFYEIKAKYDHYIDKCSQ